MGLIVGLALASSGVRAATRWGPDERIEVTVEASFANADTTRGWIEDRATETLDGHEPGLEAGDAIRIFVRGGSFDYRISLVLLRQGVPLADEQQPPERECACSTDEMLETLAAVVEAGARTLNEVAARERKPVEIERPAKEPQKQDASTLAAQPTGYRPSKLGRAGIGVLATGGAVVLSGIVMSTQPPQLVYRWQAHERDWSGTGVTTIGIGGAAMVAGLTVLIVDVVRCRRDRAKCGTRRAGGGW